MIDIRLYVEEPLFESDLGDYVRWLCLLADRLRAAGGSISGHGWTLGSMVNMDTVNNWRRRRI